MLTATDADPNRMLTTEEAALLLGLKPATLSNWREDGSEDLPFSKFGRSVRYRYADVIAFADRRRVTSTLAARQFKQEVPTTTSSSRRSAVRNREQDRLQQPDLLLDLRQK